MRESRPSTVLDRLTAVADQRPAHPALIEDGQVISYGDLARRVDNLAAALAAFGVAPGMRIGLSQDGDVRLLLCLLAVAAAGAAGTIIDRSATANERRLIADTARLDMLVVQESTSGQEQSDCPVELTFAEVAATPHRRQPIPAITPEQPFVINTTSGTTGRPKVLMLSHADFLRRFEITRGALGWGDRERYLSIGHMAFTATRNGCLFHLMSGNTVHLISPYFRPEDLLDTINEAEISVTLMVPAVIRQILAGLRRNGGGIALPKLQYLWLTGSNIESAEKHRIAEKVTPNIYDEYGAAGFGTISCLTPADISANADSVGRAVPEVEIEIVDDAHQPLPVGESGRLRCRRRRMTPGFEGQSDTLNEEQAEGFHNGWYYPGELAQLDGGGYLRLIGRLSGFILRGGSNIDPGEIEAALRSHPGIDDVAVVSRPAADLDEEVVAFYAGPSVLPEDALRRHCLTQLSAHKLPTAYLRLSELPKTVSGKLRIGKLRELAAAAQSADQRSK